tara:strand:- start:147 stop:1004 length:858 start_codon:yes stop_codon:yes gene_type:complete
MPYIGTSPSNGVRRVHTYTATASQTTFSGSSNEGQTLSYVDTNYIDVYQNGVLLGTADYTSTSGTSVVLGTAASENDIIVITVYDVFSVADTVSKTSGGNFDSDITVSSSAVKVAGKETIYVPAAAMYPNTTNGCASLAQVELSNGPEIKVLDFDASSDENAQFTVAFPDSWNEGTVTFQAFFTVTGTNTGTVAWGLSGVAVADNDSCDTAFGTNVVATAKAHSGTSNDINVTAESGAVTIAGSPSTSEFVFFQVMRDVSADNQSGDARLLGIKLFFTTDAKNDG